VRDTLLPILCGLRKHPGGKDNFAADRELGEQTLQAYPNLVFSVRANRAFLARTVRFLAGEMGIGQFLDIGTGIPTANNTHEVAQRIAPTSRIVYVDNDHCKSGCAHAC
jgi:S-adenosyl methyltransferase